MIRTFCTRASMFALVLMVSTVPASTNQERLNVAGKWVVVGSSTYVREVGGIKVTFGSSLLDEAIATQTDKELVFKGPDGAVLLSIAWDGSERRGPIKGEKGRELVWKARMDDGRVVVDTSVVPPRNRPPEAHVLQVLSLDSSGQLVLEYQQVPGWPVLKFVYKRASSHREPPP